MMLVSLVSISDNGTIILVSPAASGAANMQLNITVQVIFNDSSQWQVATTFMYKANPNITGIQPLDHVVT
jgi:hypothetical protein